jgi:Flp pilus assembly pilin Flp
MESAGRLYIRAREALITAHRGQTFAEYAIVVALIAVALISSYQTIGRTLASTVSGIDSTVASA